jgi:hypothetical protein
MELLVRLTTNDPDLRNVEYRHGAAGPGKPTASELARALASNTTVTQLDLIADADGGLEQLLEGVAENKTIRKLYLGDIGSVGAKDLAQLLDRNSTLRELRVWGARAAAADPVALAIARNVTLTSLALESCSLGSGTVQAIVLALERNSALRSLDLGSNRGVDASSTICLARALATNRTLTSLGMRQCSAEDEGAQEMALALHSNGTLRSLDISFNNLGDAAAASFANALQHNTALTSLDLFANGISDVGCAALASSLELHNSTLTNLNLFGIYIETEGAVALSKMLAANTSLKSLGCGNNSGIESDGKRRCTVCVSWARCGGGDSNASGLIYALWWACRLDTTCMGFRAFVLLLRCLVIWTPRICVWSALHYIDTLGVVGVLCSHATSI